MYKTLNKVYIGPLVRDSFYNKVERDFPVISSNEPSTGDGDLYDTRMGLIDKLERREYKNDYAKLTGTVGVINLPTRIFHPMFYNEICRFMRLFKLTSSDDFTPEPIPQLEELVRTYSHLTGFRKFYAITSEKLSKTKWVINNEGHLSKGKDNDRSYTPDEVYEWLTTEVTPNMMFKRNVEVTKDTVYKITYEDLGINPHISRPELFIIDYIPMLPNIFRMPSYDEAIVSTNNVYNKIYKSIIKSSQDLYGIDNIIRLFNNYLKDEPNVNIEHKVFTSSKEGFIRGNMLSKVGGQIGRSVVSPTSMLKPNQVGIPRNLAKNMSYRIIVTEDNINEVYSLIDNETIDYIKNTDINEYIKISKDGRKIKLIPGKTEVIRSITDKDVVIINRQPTLHRNSMLGFEVVLHDDDTIKVHNSATKGFGMDFDGDEANIWIPFSDKARREVKELMFIDHHMVSLASSSLIVGYHQDVNLAAHLLTLPSTLLPVKLWHRYAIMASKGKSYIEHYNDHKRRCLKYNINIFSGVSLYSTILPSNMNLTCGSVIIKDGILVSGTLDSKSTSGSANSIGMYIYRVYGSSKCIDWLHLSYRMLNEYLLWRGSTLSFDDMKLTNDQVSEINRLTSEYRSRRDLLEDVNPDSRQEYDIIQEMNNVRENIAMIVMKPNLIGSTLYPSGMISGMITLYINNYDIHLDSRDDANVDKKTHYMSSSTLCVNSSLEWPKGSFIENNKVIFDATNMNLNVNLYTGIISIDTYTYPMSIVYRFTCTVNNVYIDKTYTGPNNLISMIESGARGNSSNVIQMMGIVGQNIFSNGRIPRMITDSYVMYKDHTLIGTRSSPVYEPTCNTPESRGFISTSYTTGINIDEYISLHVAARENLISNYIMTPKTGYMTRRLRTFLENIKVSNDKYLKATDEHGNIVSLDYILDPSKSFKIENTTTFTDIKHLINSNIKTINKHLIYIEVDFYNDISKYKKYNDIIDLAKTLYKDTDIILGVDTNIELHHSGFIELHKNMCVTIPLTDTYWYLKFTEYNKVLVIPKRSSNVPKNMFIHDVFIDTEGDDLNSVSYHFDKMTIYDIYEIVRLRVKWYDKPFVFTPKNVNHTKYSLIEKLYM